VGAIRGGRREEGIVDAAVAPKGPHMPHRLSQDRNLPDLTANKIGLARQAIGNSKRRRDLRAEQIAAVELDQRR
jgi:hypothetical protein